MSGNWILCAALYQDSSDIYDFRDLLNRKIIAMLVTVSIFLFLFFIYIDSLLGFIIPANYLPFLDLCIPYELYIGQAIVS